MKAHPAFTLVFFFWLLPLCLFPSFASSDNRALSLLSGTFCTVVIPPLSLEKPLIATGEAFPLCLKSSLHFPGRIRTRWQTELLSENEAYRELV